MGSPGAARSLASSRRLPTVVLLLLAALTVALAPAVRGEGDSALSGAAGWTYSAVHPGDAAERNLPAPARVVLGHAPAAPSGVERPTFHAILPAVVVLAPLPARAGGYGADEAARALARSGGPARGPPTSPA